MAEWSNLPAELLELIANCLYSEIDLLRFRSVCPTWRSAILALSSPPSIFPILPVDGISFHANTRGFVLSKRTIYCIKRPLSDQSSWIVKLEHDSHDRTRLINPLIARCPFEPFPDIFPKFFNFWNLHILELGCEYTLQDIGFDHVERVAFCFDPEDGVFYVLAIQYTGHLAMYMSSDTKWTSIDYPLHYFGFFQDVIFYSGNFYALTSDGALVVVKLDSRKCPYTSMVAGPIYCWKKKTRKFLVESCGDLLLVNMYMTIGPANADGFINFNELYEGMDCFVSERGDRLEVFRLDIAWNCWDEVSSLGDRILFLGDDCKFSASVSELSFRERGNRILFTVNKADDEDWVSGVGVFDLEDGSFGPLSSYSSYSEGFWPPPNWVYPTSAVEASDTLV